jgi:class 3 adenylate cyclase
MPIREKLIVAIRQTIAFSANIRYSLYPLMDTTENTTIVFADVVDSSRLYATYGDAEARRIVASCLDAMTEIVSAQKGAVVKTLGDEVMCTFPSPDDAVTASVAMQHCVQKETTAGKMHASLKLRVGLHTGEVVREKNDIFGDAVNLAARMAALSKAHQIMTTRQTVEALDGRLRPLARFVDQSTIKGQSGNFDLYEIVWNTTEATMATSWNAAVLPQRDSMAVDVSVGDRTWTVNAERPSLTIGRSGQCDVVLEDTKASRLHARIEFIKDRFVLRDASTNGTHVRLEETGDHHVRRDELSLSSSGLIMLGRPVDADSPLVIRVLLRKDIEQI